MKITDLAANLESPSVAMDAPEALLSPLSHFMTEDSRKSIGASGVDCRFNEDECDKTFAREDNMFGSSGEVGMFAEGLEGGGLVFFKNIHVYKKIYYRL